MVSIIIPAYNKADLTVQAVESVLAQTYEDIEIIVVDDGSTDDTAERLKPYSASGKIRYIYEENSGACSARNKGIEVSSGEYLGFLDCDDLYMPDKVLRSVAVLEADDGLGFVHSAAFIIDEDDELLRIHAPAKIFSRENPDRRLLERNFICNSSVIVRKKCLDKVGYFDEKIFIPADLDLWIRLAEKYKLGYIDEPLIKYRRFSMYTLSNLEKAREEELYMLEKCFERNNFSEKEKSRYKSIVFYNNAENYIAKGEREKALSLLKHSLTLYKFRGKTYLLLAGAGISLNFTFILIRVFKYFDAGRNVLMKLFS